MKSGAVTRRRPRGGTPVAVTVKSRCSHGRSREVTGKTRESWPREVRGKVTAEAATRPDPVAVTVKSRAVTGGHSEDTGVRTRSNNEYEDKMKL